MGCLAENLLNLNFKDMKNFQRLSPDGRVGIKFMDAEKSFSQK